MTVAEPWRCPCGISPESHHICSAGTCWWCLADRVKAQSDAEPDASAGLIEAAEIVKSYRDKVMQQFQLEKDYNKQLRRRAEYKTLADIEVILRSHAADRSGK